MKTLLPYIFSTFIPGSGQLYQREYIKGLILLLSPIAVAFFIPLIPFHYVYLLSVIISLTYVFLNTESKEGRTKAIKYLIFSLVLALVVFPITFYLFTVSMYKGGQHVKNEYLNSGHTKTEMAEITKAFEWYYSSKKAYPTDYKSFVLTKPIWSSWLEDSWGTPYKYESNEPDSYKLTSAGTDLQFDTPDDIVSTN